MKAAIKGNRSIYEYSDSSEELNRKLGLMMNKTPTKQIRVSVKCFLFKEFYVKTDLHCTCMLQEKR